MENFIRDLHYKLSKGPAILTKEEAAFEAAYERWTEIDRKTPAVIVHPACEQDLAILVEKAHAAKVPFVPTTGGHSPWSTVEHGIVIDMSRFKEIVVGPDRHTVVVRGGVLMKNLQLALSGKGQFTTVANGNTVGVIPYAIGGGISSYTPLIGYACEYILSAKIVVANGKVVRASEAENKAMLWAILWNRD